MIPIKTAKEIDKMRKAGRILAEIMDLLETMIKAELTTASLDKSAVAAMAKFNVKSAFRNYHGFPGNICVSINEEVVHGIPGLRKLAAGDIVSIDIGIELGGFYADMAKTFPVGKVDKEKQRLIEVTRFSLDEAIRKMKPYNRLFDVSYAVQQCAEANKFSVVRNFVGHGIGKELHEEPQVPNYGIPHTGPELKEGMVFALEPMINAGSWEVEILKDGWTAVTKDRKSSAHFEHTVAIVNGGPLVLTQ